MSIYSPLILPEPPLIKLKDTPREAGPTEEDCCAADVGCFVYPKILCNSGLLFSYPVGLFFIRR